MKNPFGSQPVPGSYKNLQQRIFQRVQAKVNNQILGAVMQAYEDALNTENIVISRQERNRLFSQILKLVLEDVIKKHDGRSGSA